MTQVMSDHVLPFDRRWAWAAADWAALVFGSAVAGALFDPGWLSSGPPGSRLLVSVLLACLYGAWLAGAGALYVKSRRAAASLGSELRRLGRASVMAGAVGAVITAVVTLSWLGFVVGVVGAALAFVLIAAIRLAEFQLRSRQGDAQVLLWRTDARLDLALAEMRRTSPDLPWREVRTDAELTDVTQRGVRQLVVTDARADGQTVEALAPVYRSRTPMVSTAELYEECLERSPIVDTPDGWYAPIWYSPRSAPGALAKRIVDLAVSVPLLVIVAPVIAVLGLAVRLESRGPAIFKQTRSGRGGELFTMYKLRTMTEHKDDSAVWPSPAAHSAKAHHVTRLGRLLRRTGLDELPQLLNVVVGQMSLVGPRPRRPVVIENVSARVPHFAIQYAATPGISGWASIHSGEDIDDASILEKTQYNLYYARYGTLLLDLRICAATVVALSQGKKPASLYTAGLDASLELIEADLVIDADPQRSASATAEVAPLDSR